MTKSARTLPFRQKYLAAYDKLIARETRKHGCSHCYYGHTHLSRRGPGFTNVGSFKDGYFVETRDTVILSDLHLGLFPYTRPETENLKKILKGEKRIILLGDFFDLFYDKPTKIRERFEEIITLVRKRLAARTLVYIRGNHDSQTEKHLGLKTVDAYVEGQTLFIHGHTCDPLMNVFPLKIFYLARMRLGHKWPYTKKVYLRYWENRAPEK